MISDGQPQDHVAVALARAARGLQPIEHIMRRRDQVAAVSEEGREAKCRWNLTLK
jgi:hypothetical protein